MDAVSQVPLPRNEPIRAYPPDSSKRPTCRPALADLAGAERELPDGDRPAGR